MHASHSASHASRIIAFSLCLVARLAAATAETAPSFEWATSAGGLKNDKTRCIATDTEGNVFLAGSFGGTAKFSDASITSAGSNDLYAAKLRAK